MLRSSISLVFILWSIIYMAKPLSYKSHIITDTIPAPFTVEKKESKNLNISAADLEYLNSIEANFSKNLNQSLLYNNYPSIDDSYINYVDDNILQSRLEELGNKTPLDVSYSPIVKTYIDKYLKMGHYMGKVMGLAEYYFPLFEAKLAKYNVPLEIKYLAIVESQLNPRAGSNKGAIGLWQFIMPTGKQYGLEINSYVDERMDPIKSTEAACEFLEKYYKIYGDWYLALAAYNCGPGNVNKAIVRSNGQKNYWNVRPYLPKETQGYVPTFIAMYYMFEYANKHNMKPNRLDISMHETDTVWVRKKISFKEITKYVEIPEEKIEFLNPQYKLNYIPYSTKKQYVLRLPRKDISKFVSSEREIYNSTELTEVAKTQPAVAAGTTFSSLSTISEAQKKPEQTPPPVAKVEPKKIIIPKKEEIAPTGKKQEYIVKRGDYLGLIASQYKVSKEDIMQWNKLSSQFLIVGQHLQIYSDVTPAIRKEVPKPEVKKEDIAPKESKIVKKAIPNKPKRIHIIKSGESLGNIAKEYKVSIEDIKSWNNLNNELIYPGQNIIVYTDSKPTSVDKPTTKKETEVKKVKKEDKKPITKGPIYHKVKSGDTLYSLAKKYEVSVQAIKSLNNLKTDNLKLNQNLLIKK